VDGHETKEPSPGARRLLAWLESPAAAWTTICAVLVLLTCFGVTDILLAREVPPHVRRVLATSNVLAHLSYAVLAPVLLHVLSLHRFRRGSALRDAAWHAAAALALGGVAVLVMQLGLHFTVRPLASIEAVLLRTGRSFRYNVHDVFLVYALLAGSVAALELFRRERRRGLAAVALGRELTAAHLEALRLRVDPHFLLSTLNALLPLVATRPDAACDAVVRLGTLLRLGFRNASAGLVPIREEAEYVRCLLVLEEMRVSDRLSVLVDFSSDVLDAAIPALVVKPFLEEALAAGVFQRPGAALLEVVARPEGEDVVIRVKSTVRDAPGAGTPPGGAIAAATRRLEQAFGSRQSVRVTWTEQGSMDAVLRFPRTDVPAGGRAAPEHAEPRAAAPPAAPLAASRPTPLLDRPVRLAALAAGIWLAIGLYYGSQAHLRAGAGSTASTTPAGAHYVPPLVRSAVWAFLTPAVLLLYRRRPLSRRPLLSIPAHLLAAAAVSALAPTVTQVVLSRVHLRGLPSPAPLPDRLAREIAGEAGTYLLLAAILLVLDMARRARAAELRSAHLEAHLAEARLAALRTQLHPHFLFNTLNGILPRVRLDPEGAAQTLVQLGDLLRASLGNEGENVVPLASEVNFLRRYLELEKTRFPDRLTVTFDVSGEALHAAVPRFVLQPLVENAVKHGISRCPGPGTLTLSARREGGSLAVEVRNAAPGAGSGPLPPSDGIGLSNARARLTQLYGSAAALETGPADGDGFRALLRLPFVRSGETRGHGAPYRVESGLGSTP
jgi:LytS/YehU family sensor histidine kinase